MMEGRTELIASVLLAIALELLAVLASNVIHRTRVLWIQPSGAAMLVGVVMGAVLGAVGQNASARARFSGAVFYFGMLPPIVFAAGYTLKKKVFFQSLGSILLLAFAGTVISAFVFAGVTYAAVKTGFVSAANLGDNPALSCLVYGALIAATDPVGTLAVFADMDASPQIYNLVFGGERRINFCAIVVVSVCRILRRWRINFCH